MKAKIADVTVKYREIELPDVCPNCGVDFAKKSTSIRTWEFHDQERHGGRVLDRFLEDKSEEAVPRGGETFIEGLAYYCRSCDHTLAENVFVEDRSAMPQEVSLLPDDAPTSPGGLEEESYETQPAPPPGASES